MYKLIFIIFLLWFPMVVSAQTPMVEKLTLNKGKLYAVQKVRGSNTLQVRDTVNNDVAHFKLPVESARGFKIAYDIHDRFIYSISIMEYAPLQYAFFLIKSDLQKLDPLLQKDTSEVGTGFKFYGTQSIESHFKIDPLGTAIYEAPIKNIKVNFSLLLLKNGTVELFILQGDQLSIWQLNREVWKQILTTTSPFASDFIAVEHKGKKYLIAGDNSIYEVGKKINEVTIQKAPDGGTIMVDKTRDRISRIPGTNKISNLRDVPFNNGKDVFEK